MCLEEMRALVKDLLILAPYSGRGEERLEVKGEVERMLSSIYPLICAANPRSRSSICSAVKTSLTVESAQT